jgi:hypothetical protein
MNLFTEKVNIDKLHKIHTNFDYLYDNEYICSLDEHGINSKKQTKAQMKTVFDSFYESHKTGSADINYRFTKNLRSGRRFSITPSLQSIPRKTRHTLSKGIYHDLDMKNAHPTILNHLSKLYKVECPILELYVNDREHVFNELSIFSKDVVKVEMLTIINGGAPTLCNYGIIQDFVSEMNDLRDVIMKKNPSLKKRAEKQNPTNISGSCTNYLLCEWENNILTVMSEYLQENNIEIGVLVFDGIMIKTDSNIETLCENLSECIKSRFNIDIVIVEKIMDEGYDDILDTFTNPIEDENIINSNKEEDIEKEAKLNSSMIWNGTTDYTFEDFKTFTNILITRECIERFLKKNIFEVHNNGCPITYITRFTCFNEQLDRNYISYNHNIKTIDLSKKCVLLKYVFLENKKMSSIKEVLMNIILKDLSENCSLESFSSLCFDPYLNTDHIRNKNKFNIFRGFTLKNDNPYWKNDSDISSSLFYNHIRQYFCKGDQICFEYFLNWIAHMIQYPNICAEVMIIIVSEQGLGKDMISRFLGSIIGLEYYKVFDDVSNFFSRFNGEQENAMLTVLNELAEGGDVIKNHNKLKANITRLTTRVEKKGVEPYTVNHFSRYIGFTQNRKCINIENHDRRFFMLEGDNSIVGNHVYFNNLKKELDDKDFMMKTFSYFGNKDLSSFEIRNIPMTDIKKEQKINNLSSPLCFIMDLFTIQQCDEENYIKIHTGDLYLLYSNYISTNGGTTIMRKNFVLEIQKLKVTEYCSKFSIIGIIGKKTGYKINFDTLQSDIRMYLRDPDYILDRFEF